MALRRVRTTFTAVMAITACASVLPAAAQTIVVTPSTPRPGQRVHISVPGCSTGPTPHTAMSAAFAGVVTLHGKADTGDADLTIRQELKPGTYPITAHCGANHTVLGQIAVAANGEQPSAGREHRGSNALYWLFGAAAAILAGVVFLLRRRRSA